MYCSNCGTFNQVGSFCTNCGLPLQQNIQNNQVQQPVTQQGVMMQPIMNQIPDGVGTITVNRSSNFYGLLISIDIYVDGYLLGSVGNGQTKQFQIYYGTHTLVAKTIYEEASLQINIDNNYRNLYFETGIEFGMIVSHPRLTFTHYTN
mgnify:CR=1 FL=1